LAKAASTNCGKIIRIMNRIFGAICITAVLITLGCAKQSDQRSIAPAAQAQATPGKNFTPPDVAKLKWIEGTWRGLDGDKPFYERYRIENDALIVETLTDGDPNKVENTDRFELKNGEFGKGEGDDRSAASEIGDNYVQFVPAAGGKGNNFRFERQADGSWQALLEWPAAADKAARSKVYRMEPWRK
jgi:hypothetical protein